MKPKDSTFSMLLEWCGEDGRVCCGGVEVCAQRCVVVVGTTFGQENYSYLVCALDSHDPCVV